MDKLQMVDTGKRSFSGDYLYERVLDSAPSFRMPLIAA